MSLALVGFAAVLSISYLTVSSLAGFAGPPLQQPAISIEEFRARFQAEHDKSDFSGTLNGFNFVRADTPIDQINRSFSPKCTATNLKEIPTSQLSPSHPLSFSPTFIPVGARPMESRATACEDDIIAVVQAFGTPTAGAVSFVRRPGNPLIPSHYSADLLGAMTIGGRPAVATKQLVPKGRVLIFMRDASSQWQVNCTQMTLEDCVKAAEGVK
ncbi:MAG: hypothetical protein U0556_01635 [Dehalococcoidia bacterium]